MDEGAPESGGVIVKIMAVGGLNKEKGRQAFGLLPFGGGLVSRRRRARAAARSQPYRGLGLTMTF